MLNARSRGAIMALAALLAGCAQTPAQVVATDPVRVITFIGTAAAMATCLTARMEEMYAGWTVSVRGEPARLRIQAHGGVEVGTVAVIAFDGRRASLHFSPNVLTQGHLADQLENAMHTCDKP